jgi:hypothetical protein
MASELGRSPEDVRYDHAGRVRASTTSVGLSAAVRLSTAVGFSTAVRLSATIRFTTAVGLSAPLGKPAPLELCFGGLPLRFVNHDSSWEQGAPSLASV